MGSHGATGPIDDAQLRMRVARVLDIGFRVAASLMAVGLALSLIERQPLGNTLEQPRDLVEGLVRADPGSVIGAGIAVIILTPIVSAFMIAWTFHEQGNRRFARISGLVLLILVASIGLSLL